MSSEASSFSRQSYRWVKSDAGSTFLCPIDVIRGVDSPSEDQLRTLCVDESLNPHNE